jgi:hypothetical protein
MTKTLLLRIACIISVVFALGHSMGGLQSWSPIGDTEVLRAMRDTRFDVMGVSRTYLDFYLGFGWQLSVFLLLQAVWLWQLASLAKTNRAAVQPMLLALVVASIATTILSGIYIFPIPTYFGVVLSLNLVLALTARS